MKPSIELDAQRLAANARACSAYAGIPVRAVIKGDGYGWGLETLTSALDREVCGYYVSDADEAFAARRLTDLPIATLADPAPELVGQLCEARIIPNVSRRDVLDAAVAYAAARASDSGRPQGAVRIRVGLRPAAGWFGIAPGDVDAFAARLVGTNCEVELWTHLTHESTAAAQRTLLAEAAAAFEARGVAIAGYDIASTAVLSAPQNAAAGARAGNAAAHVRVGAGLFGARLGAAGPALRSAIHVTAPLVDCLAPGRVATVGYGTTAAPPEAYLIVLRCGYGDGFPKQLAGSSDILSVGMQYTVIASPQAVTNPAVTLIGEHTDLDVLCEPNGFSAHQLIVGLGLGRRAVHATEIFEHT